MNWNFESRITVRDNIKVILMQEIERVVFEDDGDCTEDKLAILRGMFELAKAIVKDIEG